MRITVGVLVLLSGCASSKYTAMSVGVDHFPKRETLQLVAQRALTVDLASKTPSSFETWTLKGPFPASAGVTTVSPTTP